MAALLTYARDTDTDRPVFAVVADDEGADYVWPADVEPAFDATRIADLQQMLDVEPEDAEGWLELATQGLGIELALDPPFEDLDSIDEARSAAEDYLTKDAENQQDSEEYELGDDVRVQNLAAQGAAFSQVSADYPGFGEDGELDEQGMNNLVLMALGPIDPDGPNGWILRAMDGNPAPGDENEYVHFPGTMLPEDESTDEATPADAESPSEDAAEAEPPADEPESPTESDTENEEAEE